MTYAMDHYSVSVFGLEFAYSGKLAGPGTASWTNQQLLGMKE